MSDDPLLLTRREAIASGAAVMMATALSKARGAPATTTDQPATISTVLDVNGTRHELQLEPRATLLDTLREKLTLFGTKKGCDIGQCGACTVHIDGRRVLSCLTLAVQATGRKVTTIEGIAPSADRLHPMQQAFLDNDALQCGYCTPGQIMSAIACVNEGHAGSDAEIREYMSGNLCRCGAYRGILGAVRQCAKTGGV